MFALRLIEFAVLLLLVYIAVSQIIIPAITGSRYFPLFNPAPFQSTLVKAQMDLNDVAVKKEALTYQQKTARIAASMREGVQEDCGYVASEEASSPFLSTKYDERHDVEQVSIPTQQTKE